MMQLPRMVVMVLAAACAATIPVCAGMELVLHDGTILKGTDLELVEDNYVLTLEDGEAITLPLELVASMRLTGEAPTGIRTGEAETIVGEPVSPPKRTEQLERLGPSAHFREDVVENSWEPSTDWDMNPDTGNNFAPSTWPENLIESVWLPKSAWDGSIDVLASGRTTWRKSSFISSWTPTDGFRGSTWWP